MTLADAEAIETFAGHVRLHVFQTAADTARVPQPREIAVALHRSEEEVVGALRHLAQGKVLILAPNSANIWAANPFCAVPSGFRVHAAGKSYWGICIWDALGICAALDADALVTAFCGDCSATLRLEVRKRELVRSEGIVHFAIPAHHWWDNIGFT